MVIKLRIFLASLLMSILPLSLSGIAHSAADPAANARGLATATFAAGCFWCVESDFDKVQGVVSTTSGFTGGKKKNPTYEQVSAGGTGHTEAVQVVYDPKKVSYAQLLKVFWNNVDPFDANGQFCDKGDQYRSAIFYGNQAQKQAAEQSKTALEKSGSFEQPIVTEIAPVSQFYAAEEYHQNFYKRNPVRYKFYRFNCGRDARLEELWGKHG
jgi:peptide-methionine (S)-S-oxide reductase